MTATGSAHENLKASVYQRLSLQVVAAFVGGECATNDEEQSSDFAIVAQEAIAL